jgi:hypothetical protein
MGDRTTKLLLVTCKNSAPTSQRALCFSITKTNRLTSFRKISALCCESHKKHEITRCYNAKFLNVKAGGTYSNHRYSWRYLMPLAWELLGKRLQFLHINTSHASYRARKATSNWKQFSSLSRALLSSEIGFSHPRRTSSDEQTLSLEIRLWNGGLGRGKQKRADNFVTEYEHYTP